MNENNLVTSVVYLENFQTLLYLAFKNISWIKSFKDMKYEKRFFLSVQ